jgi:hypothetical protein
MRIVISNVLERKRDLMTQKLEEVLAPHLRCHPITYDPCFEDDVQSGYSDLVSRNDGIDEDEDEDDDGDDDDSPDATPWTEEHALCYAEAYYKVA